MDVGSSQNITWSANNYLRQSSSAEVGTQISGGGAVNIAADNNVAMRAADVNAKGALTVNAGGNVLIEAGENSESLAEGRQSTSRGTFSSKTTTTRSSSESTTAQASELGGQSVSVTGQNVVSVGTRFESTDGVLHIEGADKTLLYATQDSQKSESSSETKRSFLGMTTGKSESTSSSERSTAVRTELISDEAVRIGVGERTELVGARVQAPQIEFVRSQNAAPNAAGELHLGAATETDKASEKSTTTTLGVWQKQEGSGHERNTAQMTELLGAVQIAPDIALSVQLPREVNTHNPSPAPSLQTQVQQLASANPGLAYLAQLQANPAVKWSELELAQREWSYSQQGLTGAGAALVALAVAWATGGMGVELLGSTTAGTTTLGGVTLATSTGVTAAGAALNAGFAGLASTASVSLINNGGDIGKTLRELGSKDSLKSLLLSMATAGALNGLSNSLTINGQTLASITPQTADFGANLAKAAINNVASAAINSALTGASLEDSIQTALVGALVSTAAGQTANWIGDVTADSPALKALAHALAGCVAGAAGQGGGAGCSAGAAGAVVGELAAQWYNPSGDPSKADKTVAFAGLMGGLAGALATGDGSAASVNTAATTGANAALNNYLAHAEAARLAALKEKRLLGQCDSQCESDIRRLETLDRERNLELARCEGSQSAQCQQATQAVRQAAAEYIRKDLNAPTITHTYMSERDETIALARQTMGDFTVWNVVQGVAGSVADGVQGLAAGAKRGFDAFIKGDPQAQQEIRQTLGAVWEAAQGPDFWLGLVGAMSPAQREQLALAYERGDGKFVAQMVGEVLSNTPMGGPAGTVKRVGQLADNAADAARLQQLTTRADVKTVVEVPAGSKGNWDPRINTGTTGTLSPSTAYVLDNGHAYITDGSGRVKEVTGTLSPSTMDRNTYQQGCAGRSGCAGDDGGHLIASSLGGAGDRINIVPQAATLNRQDWKDMENFLRNELKAGKSVTVKIDVGYPASGGVRPSEFTVVAYINGKPRPFEFKQ